MSPLRRRATGKRRSYLWTRPPTTPMSTLLSATTRRTWLALQPIRRVTFIANVNPGQDPSDGPNYFNFDDEVQYTINIDNDRDGKADDIVYESRFKTENRPIVAAGDLTSPLPYLGNPHITSA